MEQRIGIIVGSLFLIGIGFPIFNRWAAQTAPPIRRQIQIEVVVEETPPISNIDAAARAEALVWPHVSMRVVATNEKGERTELVLQVDRRKISLPIAKSHGEYGSIAHIGSTICLEPSQAAPPQYLCSEPGAENLASSYLRLSDTQ